MKLMIVGPQGSGKGTQAKMIVKKYKIMHISTGDLLREAVKNKTEIGLKMKDILDRGELVPDEIVISLIKEKLKEAKNGFILDGFPRNLEQTKALDKITKLNKVIDLIISDEESIKRISGRRSCPKCGSVFHVANSPPKKKDVCDNCKTKLIQRDDDKEEVIKKRLAIYHEQTALLEDFYRNEGILKEINGEQPIDKVTEDIVNSLESE